MLVFGDTLKNIVQEHFDGFKNFNTVSSIFTELLFIFATFLVFLLLYNLFPDNVHHEVYYSPL